MNEEVKTEYTEEDLICPIRVVHDYICVRRLKDKKAKILTIQGADDGKFNAVVVGVGPGRVTDQVGPDGQLLINKPTVKKGDTVLMNPQAVNPFTLHGYEFAILNHFQIFGVIDKSAVAYLESNAIGNILTSTSKIHG